MAISMASLRRGARERAPAMIVYGPEGSGKTTFAAGAPGVVFAELEEGLGTLDAPTFGLLSDFQSLVEVIGTLATEEHDFKTLAVDSLDRLENLVWQETCRQHGWKSIEAPDYGKGYGAAMDVWKYLLDGFDTLRNERGMGLVLIAHAAIRKFESPETEPYDNYTPKLHESNKGIGANPFLREHVDCVFFLNFKTSIVKDRGKGDKAGEGHARGVGGGQRVLYTQKRPAFLAKNRYSMPPEIPLPNDPAMAWPTVAQFIPYYSTAPVAQTENV